MAVLASTLDDAQSTSSADGYATVAVIIRSTGHATRAASLRRAVESALSQRGVNAQCIVIFNGDDYDAETIAWTRRQPRTTCIVMDQADKPGATFVGRAMVGSEFFCYLDDDDELLDGALERRVKIIRDRELDCVATNGYYVQGKTTRLMFEETGVLRERGYVQSLLHSRNWLASCGGLFRSQTVTMSYFREVPPHREWTVVAFRVASSLKVHFEDIPTFRVNSSPESQSKKDSYIDSGIALFDELKRAPHGPLQRDLIAQGEAAAYRSMCSYYRLRKNFTAAWAAYWKAVRSKHGWQYAPYIVLLLLRRTEPWPQLAASCTSTIRRLIRRPKKYVSPSWWRPLLRVLTLRARSACLYTLPSRLRSLHRGHGKVLVFPSKMDRYQPAETYIAWKVFAACDLRITGPLLTEADIAIAWNPSTVYTRDDSVIASLQNTTTVLNARCTDIRKSTVGRHFREVFGYALEVDPMTYNGTILRKAEKNGAHDAVLLQGPLKSIEPGYVYQRVISYRTERGMVEWRVFIVGKKPTAVYRLYAPTQDRFAYWKEQAEVTTVEYEFSKPECAKLTEFCDRMGLDFGVLDVLRDGGDHRIYVCDCNNTPTGPSPTLPIPHQLRIVNSLAAAFRREYLTQQQYRPRTQTASPREAAH